jgi:hypothetical protein
MRPWMPNVFARIREIYGDMRIAENIFGTGPRSRAAVWTSLSPSANRRAAVNSDVVRLRMLGLPIVFEFRARQ